MRAEMAFAVTTSVILNVAGLNAVDRAAVRSERSFDVQQKRLAIIKQLGGTQFEFVEAPPQTPPRAPAKNGRMSDRDSVASDLTPDKENALPQAPPESDKEGPSDQLAQQKFDPAKRATMPASPSTPRPPVQASESQEQEAQMQQPEQPKSAEGAIEQLPQAPPPQEKAAEPAQMQKPQPPSLASPAAKPTPAVQGLTGRDKITTPAVSRARSHGAQVYGRTSFEATGSGMGRYMREMKEKIWLAWFPYLAFHYPKDFRAADAVLRFRLAADGRLLSVQVAESEGSSVFTAFCVEAIQRASPFGPLPEEILDLTGKDELDAEFAFHFW